MVNLWAGVLLLAGSVSQEAPDEKKVREILEKFDSDDVSVRAAAEEELLNLGETVVPLLEKARAGAGAEAKTRIDAVLQVLTMVPKWAKEFADEATSNEAYQKFEQALRAKTLDRRQAGRILSLVIQNDKASENARQLVLSAAERHRLSEVWPALLQLVIREDQENNYALSYLQRLKPGPEAADEILKALPRVKSRQTALQLLQTAVSLRPDKSKLDLAIRGMLEGDLDENLRSQLLSQISSGRYPISLKTALSVWKGSRPYRQNYGTYVREALLRAEPDDSVKELLEGLGSAEAEEVLLAADYAGRHKLADAAVPLVEALHRFAGEDRAREIPPGTGRVRSAYYVDENQVRPRLGQVLRTLGIDAQLKKWLGGAAGGPPTAALLTVVGELELRSFAGDVTAMLEGKEAPLRREAARVLGTLRHAPSVPALEARLRDEDVSVRRAALHAVVRIRGSAATPLVLAQLRSESPDVQAAAYEVLPYMEPDAVIEDLTKDENLAKPQMRYALAVFLAQNGDAALHRVMARVAGKISCEDLQSAVRLVQAAKAWR